MNSLASILYVEDDETLQFITKENLQRKGYEIIACDDGVKAWELFLSHRFDLCILDVMLPRLDGFTLAKKIREHNQEVPIIFVTAKSLQEDKIEGLMLGADDYIIKPFSLAELALKIEIFLKRSKLMTNTLANKPLQITIGKYKLNLSNLVIFDGNEENRLTYREAELIRFFYENKGALLSREEILVAVWGENDYFAGRSLDVFISRLRKYFKDDSSISIENRHGVGFVFIVNDQ